ncbi:MAG: hypothetical protein HZA15_05245 [Nitrospirae bacterium]|nr:hypothetical protein [Nitrospirota bacterium]
MAKRTLTTFISRRQKIVPAFLCIVALLFGCAATHPPVKAQNTVVTGTSMGCGVGGGSLYQSFLASQPRISAIALQLRAGGRFPAKGFTTTVRLRQESPQGKVTAETSATVAGPVTTGKLLDVTFQLPHEVTVQAGQRWMIEWITPKEGDGVLTWMMSSGDPYAGGQAYGCAGNAMSADDFVFQVRPLN